MTDKKQQIKNSITYFIPLVFNSLFPLITITIFTRILSKEEFGVWGLAMVYAIFANGLANFGMTAAYERNFFKYRKDKVKSAQLLYSTLFFVLCNFLIIAVLTYIFKEQLAVLMIGSAEHDSILFVAFIGHFFYGLLFYYLAYYKNSEQAGEYTRYSVYCSLLNLFFSVLLVAFLRVGVIGLVWAQFAAGFIIFVFLSWRFVGMLRPALSMAIFKESLLISYPLTPRIFLGVISSQFDKYMIGILATLGGVGVYGVGQRVAAAIFSFMTALQNVYSPQVYKRMFDLGPEGGKAVGQYLTPFAYVSIAPALLVSLFAEEFITIMTPESFHEAIYIVSILAMFYGTMFFGKQPQLIYAKKTHISSFLCFVSIGLNVILNIPFIMKWGAIGAAWATLVAGLISGAISFIVSQHYYRIEWEWRKIISIYTLFFCSAIAIILLRYFDLPYSLRLFVKAASLGCFVYVGIQIKVLTRNNILLIKVMALNLFKRNRPGTLDS
ncbi:MAG: oligosaccharide flippase family protein [Desulfotalea sp.]